MFDRDLMVRTNNRPLEETPDILQRVRVNDAAHPFLLCMVFPLTDYPPMKQNSGSRCVDPAPSAARIIGGVILRGTPFILAATTKLKLAVVHCHIF